jgi:hypothetical protein
MTNPAPLPTATPQAAQPIPSGSGLASRLLGVLFAPTQAFEAVASRPRSLGALLVVIVSLVALTTAFLSTQLGQDITLDQQVRQIESFGVTVTDQMYAQMESSMRLAPYFAGVSQLVFVPLVTALVAGLVLAVFTALLGGTASFKAVYAVVAHANIIAVVQQVFNLGLTYVRGELAGANLGVFAPMLEETSVGARLLGSIDLFGIWWLTTLAIGIGVLYKRRTGGISASLLGIYLVIVIVVAVVRSGS